MTSDLQLRSSFAPLHVRLLGHVAAILMRLLGATWRVRTEGPDPLAPRESRAQRRNAAHEQPPVVAAFWHRNVLIGAYYYRDRSFAAAVSRSQDGDRIAALLGALGYTAPPRGSSTRGGAAALRQLFKLVRSGTTVSVQPDGPQGPARVSKVGIVTLARLTQRPITPVGFSARPTLRFRSWDGLVLPLPFARVICRYAEPIAVPPDADDAEQERLREMLDEVLNRLTDELDSSLGS
jgi:lysophospholipid acyltransferase (LPLAT)-like uncharacterized protein